MGERQTLVIRDDLDIITARRQVRKLAGDKGLDIADQARISLAASSLAYTLGLGPHKGQITVDCFSDGARTGVRVVCTKVAGAMGGLALEAFDDMRLMVDEMTIEKLPGNDLRVTLVKWVK
jgi:hypothetical protein